MNKNVTNIDNNKHIIVLFWVIYVNSVYNILGQLNKLNKEDMNYYINYINNYKAEAINKIIINYGVRDGLATIKNIQRSKNILVLFRKSLFLFFSISLHLFFYIVFYIF